MSREVDEVHRKLQYDFYYIKYFSPWLDLLILFRTIKTMLTGLGCALTAGAVSRIVRNTGSTRKRDERDHRARRHRPAGPLDQPLREPGRQAAEDRGRHGRAEREAGDAAFAGELLGGRDGADRADTRRRPRRGPARRAAPGARAPLAISENIVIGSAALQQRQQDQHAACGRCGRTRQPANGVTRITTTAASGRQPQRVAFAEACPPR